MIEYYSSYSQLINVTATLLNGIQNWRNVVKKQKRETLLQEENWKQRALFYWIQPTQRQCYEEEIQALEAIISIEEQFTIEKAKPNVVVSGKST